MGMGHAKYSASGMYRWKACPGSIRECEGVPSVESPAAARGTYVHDLAAKLLKGELGNEYHKLEEEIQASLKLYSDTIHENYFRHKYPDRDGKQELHIEVPLTGMAEVDPDYGGTSDAILWDPRIRVLFVYDYKNGTSVVDVEENDQLLSYALGALFTFKYPAKFVEMVVVQPNAPHKNGRVRRHRVPVSRLMDFEIEVTDAIAATKPKKAPLVAGRHCFFCPVTLSCPERLKLRVAEAQDEFDAIDDDEDPFCGENDDIDPLA